MSLPEQKDFFISYNRHDRAFAEWIAGVLENAGYSTLIQAWDFRPGGNFVLDMHEAIENTKRTIAVLSPNNHPLHLLTSAVKFPSPRSGDKSERPPSPTDASVNEA